MPFRGLSPVFNIHTLRCDMVNEELAYTPALRLARLIRDRVVSPVDVVEGLLQKGRA